VITCCCFFVCLVRRRAFSINPHHGVDSLREEFVSVSRRRSPVQPWRRRWFVPTSIPQGPHIVVVLYHFQGCMSTHVFLFGFLTHLHTDDAVQPLSRSTPFRSAGSTLPCACPSFGGYYSKTTTYRSGTESPRNATFFFLPGRTSFGSTCLEPPFLCSHYRPYIPVFCLGVESNNFFQNPFQRCSMFFDDLFSSTSQRSSFFFFGVNPSVLSFCPRSDGPHVACGCPFC